MKVLPNSALTISGSNFSTNTASLTVTIGGVLATIYSTSGKEIVVGVPATAKPGKVVVTNNGVSATSVADLSIKTGVQSFISQGRYRYITVAPDGAIYTLEDKVVRKSSGPGAPFSIFFNGNGVNYGDPFSNPNSITVDASGNIYVIDLSSAKIWKISSSGSIATFAGGGSGTGVVDGKGPMAKFYSPQGGAIDGQGNLYVADSRTLRKITADGTVTTLAGDFDYIGAKEGKGSEAKFGRLGDVALDKQGNIYVTDNSYSHIRKIRPDGVSTFVAGNAYKEIVNGRGTAASFYSPSGLAVDADGNIFVCDNFAGSPATYQIRMINTAGYVSTFMSGTGNNSVVTNGLLDIATVYFPISLSLDAKGDLYICNELSLNKITFQ